MIQAIASDPRISAVAQKVIRASKDTLGDRLEKVILFGSYARGDFDAESDIDFLILEEIPQNEANKWRSDIRKKIPGIDLDYDIQVSLHVTGSEVFNKYRDVLPFYMNVIQEGVEISA